MLQNAPHGGIATPRLATSAAHKGSSLDKLQVVLGHADITTTRLYVQTSGLEVAVEMAEWF